MATGDWVTYYREADGVILGCGTVPPPSIPAGVATVNHGALRPDIGNRWDPATRSWVAIPPEVLIDRLADIVQHPGLSAVWTRLTVTQRQTLRRTIVGLLGSRRYRTQTEDVAIDPPAGWPSDITQGVE